MTPQCVPNVFVHLTCVMRYNVVVGINASTSVTSQMLSSCPMVSPVWRRLAPNSLRGTKTVSRGPRSILTTTVSAPITIIQSSPSPS